MSPIGNVHPHWVPTCDFCGAGNGESGGRLHYTAESEAREAVEDAGWRRLPNGRWQCPTCYDEVGRTPPWLSDADLTAGRAA